MSWQFEQTKNPEHLALAFEWHCRTPSFLRISCGYTFTDKELFVNTLAKGLNWIGYEDGQPKALVYGEITSDTAIQGHLYNVKHTNINFLTATITFAKQEALKQFESVGVEIPTKHRTLHGLILRAGFFDLGLHKYKGIIHGKLFESSHYIAMN